MASDSFRDPKIPQTKGRLDVQVCCFAAASCNFLRGSIENSSLLFIARSIRFRVTSRDLLSTLVLFMSSDLITLSHRNPFGNMSSPRTLSPVFSPGPSHRSFRRVRSPRPRRAPAPRRSAWPDGSDGTARPEKSRSAEDGRRRWTLHLSSTVQSTSRTR